MQFSIIWPIACSSMQDFLKVKGWANKGTLSEFSLKREPYEEVHEG